MRTANQLSTEARIYAAQVTRDLAARERAGASALAPGAIEWNEAFHVFGRALAHAGPRKAAKMLRDAVPRLHKIQKTGGCYLNAFMSRSRSGVLEVLTYAVAKHPLTGTGQDGVVVRGYYAQLHRGGGVHVSKKGLNLAYLSWHAIGRLRERSNGADIFQATNVIACCGFAGMLLRDSLKHLGTSVHLAAPDLICVGTMREHEHQRFYDVLTIMERDTIEPVQRAQGDALARACFDYVTSDCADTEGYADSIPVLPFAEKDYVSQQLKQTG
jgi:hypothetical protein